jgi:hypothetical protein
MYISVQGRYFLIQTKTVASIELLKLSPIRNTYNMEINLLDRKYMRKFVGHSQISSLLFKAFFMQTEKNSDRFCLREKKSRTLMYTTQALTSPGLEGLGMGGSFSWMENLLVYNLGTGKW